MGLLRRKKREDDVPKGRTLLAAALPVTGPEGKMAWRNSNRDTEWQKRAWYYYDAIGELRHAFMWLANAASRSVLYAAEIDEETGQTAGPTEDARAQAAARTVLGGPENLPRLLTLITLHLQVAGETFILVLPRPPAKGAPRPDRWEAVTRNSLRERGGTWSFKDPLTGVWTELRPTDRTIRVWQAHPDEQTHADCAMRAALPVCAEIERTSQNIAARLDSRLAGNGILFIPQEIDFPVAEGEQADAASFMRILYEAMSASISKPGGAEAQVPIVAQVPSEVMAAIAEGHLDLSTTLDAAVPELREQAITRLGRTVEMSREIALGEMSDANHWSAWQIEETTYKIHLEPLLLKLGMALVSMYFRETLAAMGVPDPDRFVLGWDVSEVVSRPDDTEDIKWLWGENLVSADYTRAKFGVPDDAIPAEEEAQKQLARLLVTGAPTLLENPSVAELLGFQVTPAEPAAAPLPPGAEPENPSQPSRSLPERSGEPDPGLTAAAELVVFDALSRAGNRLLTREYRAQHRGVERWALHTVIPVADTDKLMEGSFQFVDRVAEQFGVSPAELDHALRSYVRDRLTTRQPHNPALLAGHLRTVSAA